MADTEVGHWVGLEVGPCHRVHPARSQIEQMHQLFDRSGVRVLSHHPDATVFDISDHADDPALFGLPPDVGAETDVLDFSPDGGLLGDHFGLRTWISGFHSSFAIQSR